jgi:ubiquinone/menaquinone biosynthesis C-methylase UbiE
MTLFTRFKKLFFKTRDTSPEAAYDLWAKGYDSQPDNLMLALDELLFAGLLQQTEVEEKLVADIGCGTGRHWQKIYDRHPTKLTGYDVSEGMLAMLAVKYPASVTYKLSGNKLPELDDSSVDLIISTLTIAHIKDAAEALQEWNRVLRPGGNLIITDYHPTALQRGGKRTFRHNEKTISIVNYVHSIEALKGIAKQLHWQQLRLIEKVIDDLVKPYYEKQHALAAFEQFKGVPIIYGMLFKKTDVTE